MGSQVDWNELHQRAWLARNHAYAPYSKFAVGAALLIESGEIFTGCNVENASYGLTICAERAAVASAIVAGYRKFAALAVEADTSEPVMPCGACRQVLAEFAPSLPISCSGRNGAHSFHLLSALFPSPFSHSAIHS